LWTFQRLRTRQEDITNTYDVFITVVFVFGVIGIFGAGTIRYRMGFAGDVTIFQVCSTVCAVVCGGVW